jgi:hypothetical protein
MVFTFCIATAIDRCERREKIEKGKERHRALHYLINLTKLELVTASEMVFQQSYSFQGLAPAKNL